MPRAARFAAALLGVTIGLVAVVPPATAGDTSPDDPVFQQGLQWGLERIGAPGAWARGTGDGITIAIVDSGVDLNHEDLKGKVVAQVSCVGADGDAARCQGSAQDDNGHGSHVAGIALASTDNGRGIAGVAPDANLMAVRVLTNECDSTGCSAAGSAADVVAGIRWAADHGADVINLSLGGGALQGALGCGFCDAVEYAWSKGAIPVVAAGNDSGLPSGFGDEHAVVVTATTRDDQRASYSSSSSGLLRVARWPVAAPGGEGESAASDCATGGTPKGVISSHWVPGGSNKYACLAGTSMAAPHVAGALAVLRGLGHSPQSAIDQLLATARDLGPPGRDDQYGVGRVDLGRAVGAATVTTTASSSTTNNNNTTTTTTSGAPPSSEAALTSTTAAPPSTAPGETTTAPTVQVPTPPEAAAPFTLTPTPGSSGATEGPSPWIVVLAVAALLASGAGAAVTAWRLRRAGP